MLPEYPVTMNNEFQKQNKELSGALQNLQEARDRLVRINTQNGSLGRYNAMKQEILELGWDTICAKYHPDINMDDPAAFELFSFYQFVYQTIRDE